MRHLSRLPRRTRSLLILGICLLILGAVPIHQAQAIFIPQSVDNTLQNFTAGSFQRTSLGSQRVTSPPAPLPKVADETGAVQLVPIGMLSQWFQSSFNLPETLTDVGAAAVGTQIFVVGGIHDNLRTAHVWTAPVDPNTGAIANPGWQPGPDLPSAASSIDYPAPVAARSLPAVVSVTTNAANSSGFIYVMGGSIRPGTAPDTISSYAVSVGRVVNGEITSWTSGPDIPSPDGTSFNKLGAQAAQATTVTINGQTYIYLIGGLQRYIEAQNTREQGLITVFYARVGSNGQLIKPSNGQSGWDQASDLPIDRTLLPTRGLWDGIASAGHFEDTGIGGGDVLYVAGGQANTNDTAPEYNAIVYRALINSSNGSLTWTSGPGPNQWQGTMPEARTGFTSAGFGGNLYLIGGRPVSGTPGQAQKTVLSSYVEDNLTLAQLGVGGTNFFQNTPDPLPAPRTRHGTVVITATPTSAEPNAAFVYVLAGQGATNDGDTSDDQGSNTVTYGKIGGASQSTNGFAPSGWFFSKPHDINFDGAQIQEINWTTVITRTGQDMDIQLQYRTSIANDCTASNAFESSTWHDIDGAPSDSHYSVNSGNSENLGAPPVARCFQYRARLSTNNLQATPALLNVSLQIYVPGSPDLKVQSINDIRGPGNSLSNLTIVIINHSDMQGIPTQPADLESTGSFFVDLFIFGPGEQVITPTVPLTPQDEQRSKAYANISKSLMQVDTQLTVAQWCNSAGPPASCTPINLLSLFPQPGIYRVIAVVDSLNYVRETTTDPAELNNLSAKSISVPQVTKFLNLPLMAK